jgi:DNA-binding transcriptional LysR family regulator
MSKIPDLDLLRALVRFAELGTVERAAQALGVAQPTLTYQLRILEGQVGGPVFEMRGKKKWLTPFGRQLADFAARETLRLDEAYGELRNRYADPAGQILRVGCRRDRFVRVANALNFPGRLRLANRSARDALQELLSGELEVAIVHDRVDLPDLVARKVFTSAHVFVVAPLWLRGREVSAAAQDPEFLRLTPCLAYSDEDLALPAWLSRVGLKRGEVAPRLTCQDWEAIIRFASEGRGYAIVPHDLLEGAEGALKCWAVPEEELSPLSFYAVYHRELRKRVSGFKFS